MAGEIVAWDEFVVLPALGLHIVFHNEEHRLEEMCRLLPSHGSDHGVHCFIAEERAWLGHARDLEAALALYDSRWPTVGDPADLCVLAEPRAALAIPSSAVTVTATIVAGQARFAADN